MSGLSLIAYQARIPLVDIAVELKFGLRCFKFKQGRLRIIQNMHTKRGVRLVTDHLHTQVVLGNFKLIWRERLS